MGFYDARLAKLEAYGKKRVVLAGSFQCGVFGVLASYELPVASGTNITVTSDTAGTAGNALDFQATADGTATPSCSISFGTDTLAITHATAGTTKNGLVVTLIPGGTAGSEVATEDGSGNLEVAYQASVSTTTQVAAAINGDANWVCPTTGAQVATGVLEGTLANGTAATWAEESGSPSKTHLHFTDAVSSVTDAVAELNTLTSGTKEMTATGSGVHTLASGDAVAKQDLSGGVDSVAITSIRGPGVFEGNGIRGFTVAHTAAGEYTLTFNDWFPTILDVQATVQLTTAEDTFAQVGTIVPASKTAIISLWDVAGAAIADPNVSSAARVNFLATFANTGLG